VHIQELPIAGAFEITPLSHQNDHGFLGEWFKASKLEEATAHPFNLRQANLSVNKANIFRGIETSPVSHLPASDAGFQASVCQEEK
jgi:dTDP-4-dehydrorhamnose 3,5-epimerase